MDYSGLIIKLNSVKLQLQLPAGTELGNRFRDYLTLQYFPKRVVSELVILVRAKCVRPAKET